MDPHCFDFWCGSGSSSKSWCGSGSRSGWGGEGVGQPKMCIPPGKILGTPLAAVLISPPPFFYRIAYLFSYFQLLDTISLFRYPVKVIFLIQAGKSRTYTPVHRKSARLKKRFYISVFQEGWNSGGKAIKYVVTSFVTRLADPGLLFCRILEPYLTNVNISVRLKFAFFSSN